MMKRFISTFLATAALAVAPLAASAHPVTGADGVLRFPFGDKEAPAVFCRPLYVCDIVLEAGETILNVAIGDSVRWVLSPAASGTNGGTPHVLIKPTETNLATNLIVTTNRRAYYLDLHSANLRPMLRVGFLYPQQPDAPHADASHAIAQANPAQADAGHMDGSHGGDHAATDAQSTAPESLDFAYQNSGSRELFPVSVYNDGKHTYLRLDPRTSQLPVLFAIGPDGDQLINYRVKDGSVYIVDGVPSKIALLIGTGKHQQRAIIARKA